MVLNTRASRWVNRRSRSACRDALNWTVFAVIAVASIFTLVRIERSESSTAGFGVIVVPLLLTVGVLLAAVIDGSSRRRQPRRLS